MEAGREWAKPKGIDGTKEDAEMLGLPQVDDHDDIEILPENWEAWNCFLDCSTQWFIGLRGPTGLNYQSLEFVLRMRGNPPESQPDIFWRVRIIERGALESMKESRK